MKFRCIDNSHVEKKLTIGEIYYGYYDGKEWIVIESDDNGNRSRYVSFRFEEVE